ncbi:MAG: alanine racemase [Kiritimatiellae bacterium]|nr:alanine racemase [Kiritimatiellia bacterium]
MKSSWVQVDLRRLAENIRALRSALRPQTEILFVVKANAYGHGLVPVAVHAARQGVRWFGVAYLREALEVRRALPEVQILVLGAVEAADVPVLLERNITPVVISEKHAAELGRAARLVGRSLPVHLKVDTGMGRLGVWWEEAGAALDRLGAASGLEIRGLCTHFATVEPRKPAPARAQWERFSTAAAAIEQRLGGRLFRHVSSSRAALYFRDWDLDAIRPGIVLYGYGAADPALRFHTKPILQWKAHVMQVKRVPAGFSVGYYSQFTTTAPTTLATLSVGYADGYNRLLGNKGSVLIGGWRCPVVGRVSMNWITADLGPERTAQEGDEAVLLGEQRSESIWAGEMAAACRTIPYEILTDINAALDRVYIE